ncbi:ABC transporter substrate-binding protein [Humibacter albus]|uniref:ABC transporter substrate-binding protein n=1 Tax=Humibacter albus TaxID=427754 RepID=UPI0003B6EACA|nr:ABC transporter substrate-binding protein [Humibacter albus]
MSRRRLIGAAIAACATILLAGCQAGHGGSPGTSHLVVGFAQVGAESSWRTANTKDIESAFQHAGITLRFSDAEQQQANQIAAIRSYIQQRVSVIAFSPVVESGWDTVLQEAKAAGIPVILTDRAISTDDPSLYVTRLGSDFTKEGEKAGVWAKKEFAAASSVKVLEIEGTTGSAPAIGRTKGFEKEIGDDSKFSIVDSQDGGFTRAGGEQVMEAQLKAHPDVDLVYAQNDDMALGAIQAIEGAGERPGKQIKVISVDATHDGMEALAQGKINFIVECNPLLGDELVKLVKKVTAGKSVPRRIEPPERTFTQEQAIAALPTRKY